MADDEMPADQRSRRASGARPYGRYLEEFEAGAVYRHWPAKTVTEADDHLFCLITMNHHPLHLNDVYAAGPNRVATSSSGRSCTRWRWMTVADVSGKAIASLADRGAVAPRAGVPRGHAVRRERGARGQAVAIQAGPRRGARATRVYKQDGTLVAEFKRAVLVPRRDPGADELAPAAAPPEAQHPDHRGTAVEAAARHPDPEPGHRPVEQQAAVDGERSQARTVAATCGRRPLRNASASPMCHSSFGSRRRPGRGRARRGSSAAASTRAPSGPVRPTGAARAGRTAPAPS